MVVSYETHPHTVAPVGPMLGNDQIVCQCLQVTESEVREAADRCPFRSLAEIGRETGAGTGCTACHRRLRRLLG